LKSASRLYIKPGGEKIHQEKETHLVGRNLSSPSITTTLSSSSSPLPTLHEGLSSLHCHRQSTWQLKVSNPSTVHLISSLLFQSFLAI
jgi:hypothetical protein